ncbi:60S ribosomal protein L25 [Physocladia obscura]|uniref:Protein PBN1 n=1 Tax=Physocladia obscura TaxID=109957 RepID=A0AAD5X925_9FUNG|nr:60S ribosomal protein L25 [Physocladia obscura]
MSSDFSVWSHSPTTSSIDGLTFRVSNQVETDVIYAQIASRVEHVQQSIQLGSAIESVLISFTSTIATANSPYRWNLHVSASLNHKPENRSDIKQTLFSFASTYIKPRNATSYLCCDKVAGTANLNRIGFVEFGESANFAYFTTPIESGWIAEWDAMDFAPLTPRPNCANAHGDGLNLIESSAKFSRINSEGILTESIRIVSSNKSIECTADFKSTISIVSPSRRNNSRLNRQIYKSDISSKSLKMESTTEVNKPTPLLLPSISSGLSPSVGFHPFLVVSINAKEIDFDVVAVIVLHLPVNQNAFADPFQISGLNLVDSNIKWIPYGSPDLEVAASNTEKADMNGVFIVIENLEQVFGTMGAITKHIEIPLHMRYQPPSENGGYNFVSLLPVSAFAILKNASNKWKNYMPALQRNGILPALLKSPPLSHLNFDDLWVEEISVSQSELVMKMPVGAAVDSFWVLVTMSVCVVVSCGMAPVTKNTASPAVKKAAAAKKAVLKGTGGKVERKVRTSTTFRLPKTLKLARNPKYPRRSVPRTSSLDAHAVVKFPLNTESAMKKIEEDNTLVFIVDVRSNKRQIKDAVKRLYDVDAIKINTLVRPDGKKKAYVTLDAEVEALEVANRIGFI